MFSYYGSKSKIVKYYPKPKYDLIIEPFCGASNYSLYHWENRKVWINDSYEVIYRLWNYLKVITKEDIEFLGSLKLKQGSDIRELDITDDMRLLLGFVCGRGAQSPHNIYTKWSEIGNSIKQTYNRLIKYQNRAKNWKITNLDYKNIPNQKATWFIDPPYQFGGSCYIKNKINYEKLANWCKSRNGQVIVCENSKSNWLPFRPLKEIYGLQHKTLEVVYLQE